MCLKYRSYRCVLINYQHVHYFYWYSLTSKKVNCLFFIIYNYNKRKDLYYYELTANKMSYCR